MLSTARLLTVARGSKDPPFGAADGSSLIISQGTPIRSICALASSGSADERLS